MKTITICNKEYQINANAFAYIKYKHFFKTGIFEDIQRIRVFVINQNINKEIIKSQNLEISEEELNIQLGMILAKDMDGFIEAITRITWILIYSSNEKIEEYEKWLRNITEFSIADKWIVEVTELAVSSFC